MKDFTGLNVREMRLSRPSSASIEQTNSITLQPDLGTSEGRSGNPKVVTDQTPWKGWKTSGLYSIYIVLNDPSSLKGLVPKQSETLLSNTSTTHLLIASIILAQLHLLSKQGAEEPINGILLPAPPILRSHEILQLLVNREPQLPALAGLAVNLLARLGLLERSPSDSNARTVSGTGGRVQSPLVNEFLEQELVEVRIIVDVGVFSDLLGGLNRCARARCPGALDQTVGAEELVV